MRIKEIDDIRYEEAYRYLPEGYLVRLEIIKNTIDKMYMYVLEDGGIAKGFAMYLTFNTYVSLAMLIHIKIAEESRGKGLGKRLVKESANALKKHGKSYISAVNMEDFEDIAPPFLKKAGFSDFSLEHTLCYKIKDLRNSEILGFENRLRSFERKLRSYSRLTKAQIEDFEYYLKDIFETVDFERIDSPYTKYYVEDGMIMGYIPMGTVGNNIYLLDTMIIRRGVNADYIIPVFLCDLVKSVLKAGESNEDIVLRIAFYISRNEKAANKFLGEASFTELNHYWKYK